VAITVSYTRSPVFIEKQENVLIYVKGFSVLLNRPAMFIVVT